MQLAQYIRMSTALQTDSPETQKSIIKEYCERNGHIIVRSYEDEAVSAGSIEKREALIEMIMDAEKKLFEGIVIYKYDRAFRNLAEQVAVFSKLRKHNIKVIAAADPNSEGASGELIVNILGAVNQFERQLTGERIYDKNRELKKKGRWTGSGIDPFGYQYDKEKKQLLVVEKEAEIVKFAYQKYLELKTVQSVVEALQNAGHKSKTGIDWSNDRVHAMLTNPLYTGRHRWGFLKPGKHGKNRNCEVFEGQHEAIISLETYEKVQETLRHNRTYKNPTSGRIYLLGGLIRCSLCGGPAVAHWKDHLKKPIYLCKDRYNYGKSHCQGWHKMAYKIEDAVYKALIENINNINLLNWDRQDSAQAIDHKAQIEKKLKTVEAKLLRQIEMREEGDITKEDFKIRRAKTLKEKEELERELFLQQQGGSFNDDMVKALKGLEDLWDDIDAEGKREILRQFIHVIHSNGLAVKIEFKNLGFKGWVLEMEMPIK
jgi:site-specific DNA recombinase